MLAVDSDKLAVYPMGLHKGSIHLQATAAIAKKLLAQGMVVRQVAAITDLPLEDVEALAAKLQA